ncbi:DUF397 domain-containing protein [Nocardia sp. NRRL S-836]
MSRTGHGALVRDTKNPAGEVLTFSTSAWHALLNRPQR